jgi:hypothetical protein
MDERGRSRTFERHSGLTRPPRNPPGEKRVGLAAGHAIAGLWGLEIVGAVGVAARRSGSRVRYLTGHLE